MTPSRRHWSPISAGAVILALGIGLSGVVAPASAAPPTRANAATSIAIDGTSPVRLDQNPDFTIAVSGVSSGTKTRVNWGDGSATQRQKGVCSPAKARRSPAACTVTFTHAYRATGTFTITAVAGKVRGSQQVTVTAEPQPWRPSPGQTFTSWKPLGRQATYTPCQTIEWFFDTTGQPADRSTMRDDVVASLDQLAGITGLRFVETSSPQGADLTFSWRDLTEMGYAEASGVGGFTGPGEGWVAFSPTNEWTNDYWAGAQPKTRQWQEGQWIYTLSINGRQSLVTHEVMHALGFGHVEDFTSIMYPQSIGNGAGELSAGDLEGLRTMYPSDSCPVTSS